jgi:DNA-binding beta-propeller fold protein YncE
MTDPFAGLDERALRARAALQEATALREVPVFAPHRRRVAGWAAPLVAATTVLVVVAVAVVSGTQGPRRPVTSAGVTSIPAGELPVAVATDGTTAWVADAGRGELLAIDVTTHRQRWHVPVGTQPVAVAYGLRAVWVVDGGGKSLVKLDATTGRRLAEGRTSLDPVAVTVAFGSVWVLSAGNQTLDRYDPDSLAQNDSALLGARGTAVTATRDALWVAVADGLRYVSPNDLEVVPVAGDARPRQLAGAGTVLWVARADQTLVALDGTTGAARGPAVTLSGPVTSLAATAGSAFAATGDGTVHRFTAPGVTGTLVATTGTPLDALAVVGDHLAGTGRATAQLFVTEIQP